MSAKNKVLVKSCVESRLADLANLHASLESEFNPFIEAISVEMSRHSKLSRGLTSRLGKRLAAVARDLAKIKFGENCVPKVTGMKDLRKEFSHFRPHSDDTLVVSNFDSNRARELAANLIRAAGTGRTNKIGTHSFQNSYESAISELERLPRVDLWTVQVDLYVADSSLGFCELESGGELDSSNVKSQPAKLVLASLAAGNREEGLHFCLAYANKGEGNPIKGGLPTYFEKSETSETGDGLYIGRKWWEKILPEGVDYEQFMEIYKNVVTDLDIVGL